MTPRDVSELELALGKSRLQATAERLARRRSYWYSRHKRWQEAESCLAEALELSPTPRRSTAKWPGSRTNWETGGAQRRLENILSRRRTIKCERRHHRIALRHRARSFTR